MIVLELVLTALAASRMTRVVTDDTWPPTEALRHAVARRFGDDSAWFDYVTCPWCVGSWIAFASVAALDCFRSVPLPVFAGLAVAYVVGILGSRVDG